MATNKRFNEVEAFKEQVTKDFLKKHMLKPEDVAHGKISPSGHVFQITDNYGLNDAGERYELTLYKLIDRQTHTIKRNIVITYTTEPAPNNKIEDKND